MERATELEWLQYFYDVADFGPADDDIRHLVKQKFVKEEGKSLPRGYGWDE